MSRTNGKSEAEAGQLDVEHELPASEDSGDRGQSGSMPAAGEVLPRDEVSSLRAERDSLLDRLARLQAEFENARKRAAREQQEFRDYATVDAIKALLPALDSFERALQTSSEKSEFRSGVELIYKQLLDALQKLGLRPIPAKGGPFDPRLHEAIEMVETTDVPDQHVIEELQPGYKLKDRLVRPAMVRVARNHKH
jgi:molecular chaperone GrpE